MISKNLWNAQRWLACVGHWVRAFLNFKSVQHHWLLPFASAMALGSPVLVGAWHHNLSAGLTASLGALVFLYLPQTPLAHMLRSMGKSTVVMLACYGIGSLSAVFPTFHVPSLVILTALATLYCRTFNVGGPAGSMFFVIAACIGATSHTALTESLHKLMLVFTGCLWGIAVAVFYSRITRSRNTSSVIKVSITVLQKKIDQSVLIGVVVGGSLFVAQSIGLNNPYWVPISCLAVIQGSDFRDIWNKQLHRLVGTFLGVIWMSILFQSKPESDWEVAICIVLLSFAIELTVVRHYATAVMFITPMTILLADVAQAHESSFWSLMQSRLLNTSIGCIAALYGGLCLHCFRSEDSP